MITNTGEFKDGTVWFKKPVLACDLFDDGKQIRFKEKQFFIEVYLLQLCTYTFNNYCERCTHDSMYPLTLKETSDESST